MIAPAVAVETIHWAQVLTGLVFAAWLLVGVIPGLRHRAGWLRAGLLAIYLVGAASFVAYALLGRG